MKNPNFIIELYSVDKKPQGYLKSVSIYHNKVLATPNINEAKTYAKVETANKDTGIIMALTHGALLCNVVNI